MVYITLDELKEHLPIILSDWIEPGDEGWEWIFQEIEQKCHIGKKKNGKKKKVDIDTLTQRVQDLNKEVEEMHRGFIDTKNNVIQLGLSMKDIGAEINHLKRDIAATKSMAEIAKNRTEVNYSNYSSKISEDQIIQNVYNRMANRGATREELDGFRNVIKKYNATETLSYIKSTDAENRKVCKTCKYYTDREAGHGMHNSELDCYSIVGPCANYSKWEANDGQDNNKN